MTSCRHLCSQKCFYCFGCRVIHLFIYLLPLPADSYRVLVRLQCSSGDPWWSTCLLAPPEEVGEGEGEEDGVGGASSHLVLGRVSVGRSTRWSQLGSALSHAFTSYLQTVSGESLREEGQRSQLGLGPGSISSYLIGEDPGCCCCCPAPFNLNSTRGQTVDFGVSLASVVNF